MAGTIAGLALSQRTGSDGRPLQNAKLYIYEGGTSVPATAYRDSGLSSGQEHPFPILTDSFGTIPQFWLDDGTYRVRFTDEHGTVVFDTTIPAIGTSSGGGGGGTTVDETTIHATGDLKASYRTGALTGWVRLNGRTIGSATSGATERANSDTQALFTHLYTQDTNLSVSGGRGASAAADFAANKTIELPDWRGRALAALDDMGNSASGVISTFTFTDRSPTTLGAFAGAEKLTLSTNQMPAHTHTATVTDNHKHTYTTAVTHSGVIVNGTSGTATGVWFNGDTTAESTTASSGSISVSNASAGGSAQTPTLQPTKLCTFYIKL